MNHTIAMTNDALDAMIAVYTVAGSKGLFDRGFQSEMKGAILWVKSPRKLCQASLFGNSHFESNTFARMDVARIKILTKETLLVVHNNHSWISNIPLIEALNPEYSHTVYYVPGAAPCVQVSGLTDRCISQDSRDHYAYCESLFDAYRNYQNYNVYIFSHDNVVLNLSSLQEMPLRNNTAGALLVSNNMTDPWEQNFW